MNESMGMTEKTTGTFPFQTWRRGFPDPKTVNDVPFNLAK
jgi:hypothetical protein